MKNKQSREIFTGFAVIALTVLALVLFGLGFSTGYYTYGQMNSVIVTVCFGAALLIECCALVCLKKFPGALWPKLLTFPVTAALAFGALTLLGDRVEGIGNCILTDYDSGHGGEEAIYYSLGGMLAAHVAARLQRALDRERAQEKPNYAELCRRFLTDTEDFSEEKLAHAGIVRRFQNLELEACVAELTAFIKANSVQTEN